MLASIRSLFRRAFRWSWLIAVNVVVLMVLLEAAALAYFRLGDGRWYYAARDTIVKNRVSELASGLRDADSENLRRALASGLAQSKFRLSLYYGFNSLPRYRIPIVDKGELEAKKPNCKYLANVLCEDGKAYYVTNNYGFDSVLDYPYRKQSADEFVIGIFGGSIALGFIKTTMPELYDEIFAAAPQLRGKKVILLSFAREGFKQPQQLLALAYFLSIGQKFDLVVNIDGINEIIHALVNNRAGVDYSMPSDGQVGYYEDIFGAALYQETSHPELLAFYYWRGVRERLLRRMADVRLAGPAALVDLGFKLAGRFEARAHGAARQPQTSSAVDRPVFTLPQKPGTTADEAVAQSIALWRRSSIEMARLLQGFGTPYLHVLPPNQYLSNKPFTDEERKVALGWDKWYAGPTRDGYKLLREQGETLVKDGVNFASAIDIFDHVTEPLYIDDCCHTNRFGYLLLGKFIAAHLPGAP